MNFIEAMFRKFRVLLWSLFNGATHLGSTYENKSYTPEPEGNIDKLDM